MNRLNPTEPTVRAEEATHQRRRAAAGPVTLTVRAEEKLSFGEEPLLHLWDNSFAVVFPGVGQWPHFEPVEDGKPLLGGAVIRRAVLTGTTLGLHISKNDRHELRLFRGPGVTALGIVPLTGRQKEFTLSADGERVAWTRGKSDLAMADTAHPAAVRATAAHAGLHGRCHVALWSVPLKLVVTVGTFRHEFRFEGGGFAHTLTRLPKAIQAIGVDGGDRLRAAVGRFGEIVITDAAGQPLAVFLVRRDQAAAWTPAGGFWGHPALIGGPPGPTAANELAAALSRGDRP